MVQGHFAVLKTIDVSDGDDILCIEVVKMERQTSLNASHSQFLGKLYRCTKVQTNANCLEGRWYLHGNGRVTCEVDSVICTFPTFRGRNRLPKRACDAVIAEQIFHAALHTFATVPMSFSSSETESLVKTYMSGMYVLVPVIFMPASAPSVFHVPLCWPISAKVILTSDGLGRHVPTRLRLR